jgi:hypothetical protein
MSNSPGGTILAQSGDTRFGRGIVRQRAGLTALVIIVLAAAVGCTSGGDGGSTRPAGAAAPTTTAHHVASPPVPADASARQVRARFEQLLGQHALLAVRLTRSEVAKVPELKAATQASLTANTEALQQLIGVAYDSAGSDRFSRLWRGYTDELDGYAGAAAGNNAAGKQEARAAMLDYCKDWGAFLAEASDGRVDAAAAQRSAQTRVEQLMGQIDAYAARDYGQAYKLERDVYQGTFTAGTTLAKASVSPAEAGRLGAAPEQLRSAFAMLLGEHMELIVDAQRAAFGGAEEFDAVGTQINANTTTLAKALAGIVGPAKAAEFQKAWANHVEGLIAYSSASVGNDQAAKTVAKENLDGFAERLALFFSEVVRNVLATDPLTDAITAHDEHLIAQVDAFAAKDYAKAQQVQGEGYQQMVGVANVLVDAIQKVMQTQMPAGGSQTGGGGAAHVQHSR